MQYLRGEGDRQERLRDPRRPAEEEHRHRHGPRARRVPQAGRREHVRDRPGAPGARPRSRARGQPLRRRGARRRRAAARRRRPRAQRADADVRRRDAVERGPRLHPAPPAAPHGARDAPARRRDRDLPRAVPRLARRDEGGVPRGRQPTSTASRSWPTPRRRRSCARSRPARASSTSPSRTTQKAGRARARGRHRVPAARHLRLPDRPHARDGGGGRPHRRPRRLRLADDRAARPREGGREGEEDGAGRPLGLQQRSARSARRSSPATPSSRPSRACSA